MRFLDLLFVVDNSGSIGLKNFAKVKMFLKNVIQFVQVDVEMDRIGVVLFNTDPSLVFGMDKHLSNEFVASKSKFGMCHNEWTDYLIIREDCAMLLYVCILLDAIDRLSYQGGGSYAGKALRFAAEVLDGSVKNDATRTRVVMLVNDGASEDRMESAAEHLHMVRIKIGGVCIKDTQKEQMMIVTRDINSLFLLTELTKISQWLFQQRQIPMTTMPK